MPESKNSRHRWKKPSKKLAYEQMSLLGDIYKHTIKYMPKVSTSEDNLSVVVLRLPPEATDSEVLESEQEMHRLAASISKGTTRPNRNYYFKKARTEEVRRKLAELKYQEKLLQNGNVCDNIRDKEEVI